MSGAVPGVRDSVGRSAPGVASPDAPEERKELSLEDDRD